MTTSDLSDPCQELPPKLANSCRPGVKVVRGTTCCRHSILCPLKISDLPPHSLLYLGEHISRAPLNSLLPQAHSLGLGGILSDRRPVRENTLETQTPANKGLLLSVNTTRPYAKWRRLQGGDPGKQVWTPRRPMARPSTKSACSLTKS